jgi:hypothetical protein
MFKSIVYKVCLLLMYAFQASAEKLYDFSKSAILVSPSLRSPVKETVVKVLQEEVFKRSNINLPSAVSGYKTWIVLIKDTDEQVAGFVQPNPHALQTEGYRIIIEEKKGSTILWIIGQSNRAVLFGIGQFLRNALLAHKKILYPASPELETSPKYAIRGHQLGYRSTANSYDAWSVKQYEQYIRELALFGTNAIENIPFQDDKPSPHMQVSRADMNIAVSKICRDYDLDYWVWMPAKVNLADPIQFKAELDKHIELFAATPRLDGVFFPGGDPGDNHPQYVLPFLEASAKILKKHHPEATMWISLQGFSDEQVEYFFSYLEEKQPEWLQGIVSGPGSPELSVIRYRLPSKYQHRAYPDITHTVRCQYPVQNWDQAYALTEGREMSNPQPVYYAKIHNRYAPFTDGFISYSDGAHDDVNKIVWTQLAWNSEQDVREILLGYSRFFFGYQLAESVADGILALEKNWDGPVEDNGSIESMFRYWNTLEIENQALKDNWRWQLLLLRSHYDNYIRKRKMHEQASEKSAIKLLKRTRQTGADEAMRQALSEVNKANPDLASRKIKQKIVAYCEALYQSIGLQTSVEKYKASGGERGAVLDYLDYPLNNRWWLEDEFKKITLMNSEEDKLSRLEIIRTWDEPGIGAFYDNISNVANQQHVISRSEDATDFAWWDQGMSRKRLSTQLFQNFPKLRYEDLDPKGRYKIRVSGYGEALLRIDGERVAPTVYHKELEGFKEFPVAAKYLGDGTLEISFDEPEESHLNWREHSKVADIWLLKY